MLSPAKGKGKDSEGWELGFWDLYPLVQRPLQWTRSATIFTAHASQPLVVARLFSSSKQFIISAPNPPAGASYEPPTVIEATTDESWLFAYFPGNQNDGLGCFWKRGLGADTWILKDKSLFARGAGAVAATWLGPERQWVTGENGTSTRLPPRGPATPTSCPTLLIVTESQEVKVGHFRPGSDTLQMLSGSLVEPSNTLAGPARSPQDVPIGPGGTKLCKNAAIGLGYNDSAIVIATRSTLYPPFNANISPMYNLTIPVDATGQAFTSTSPLEVSPEWETWGEEPTIELCQVILTLSNSKLTMATTPLPPIHHTSHLSTMTFACNPPPAPGSPVADSSTSPAKTPKPSSPAKSPRIPLSRSPSTTRKKDSKPPFTVEVPVQGDMYLVVSFLGLGDYTSPPSSEIVLYSLQRGATSSAIARQESARQFPSAVATFISPRILADPIRAGLQVGLLDSVGVVSKTNPHPKDVEIGSVILLHIPDLTNNTEWTRTSLICAYDSVGVDLPLNATVSPNHLMMCTASSSLAATQMRVQPTPRRRLDTVTPGSGAPASRPRHLASLVSAIRNRVSTSDLTFVLSLQSFPVQEAMETFQAALALNPDHRIWTWEVVGIIVEYYQSRSRSNTAKIDKDQTDLRSQTAHDVCSLVACDAAFTGCREGPDGYDIEAVWKLISLSSWTVALVEKVMKACVMCGDLGAENPQDDLFGSAPPSPTAEVRPPALDSPTLLHLVQPYSLVHLRSVLQHVQRYRNFLGGRTPRGENAQIERSVLIDLVDYSGFDIAPLIGLLDGFLEGAKATDPQDQRRSLALCQPAPSMDNQLRHVVRTLLASPVINKARLFIKPSELVDGIMHRMSLDGQQTKLADKDVVLKGTLVNKPTLANPGRPSVTRASGTLRAQAPPARISCLRCGGKSDVGHNMTSGKHWNAWERMWMMRCVCGGFWGRE